MDTSLFPSVLVLNLHETCILKHSPEGGSTMTLQPGTHPTIQQVHQHKWPLRPGVQVHVNGTNSLTLAASGSVLLSSEAQADASSRSRSGSTGSQSSASVLKTNKLNDRQAETGNPYYETLRDQKRPKNNDESASQPTDSGSESTRSVIRIKGPSRTKNTTTTDSNQHNTPHHVVTGEDRITTGRLLTPLAHSTVRWKTFWHYLLVVSLQFILTSTCHHFRVVWYLFCYKTPDLLLSFAPAVMIAASLHISLQAREWNLN